MALWNTDGDLLQRSGWTVALTEAEVASSGMTDSFLKAAHLTRTRHDHKVTPSEACGRGIQPRDPALRKITTILITGMREL